MNSIPTTLDALTVPYTIVGGAKGKLCPDSAPISVVLLGRGNRLYRGEVLRELARAGFESVVSVEIGGEPVEMESLSGRFPHARFLLLKEAVSPGVQLNIAIRESCGPYVFVLWSDMRLSSQTLSSRFFERIAEQNILCQAPSLFTKGGEAVPVAAAPALHRSNLKILSLVPTKDGARSVYPIDYCGIYSRERFALLGGFDGGLSNPYWQKMDFGFRAWLWGEEIRVAQALKVGYVDSPPIEDQTADECYKWFWLKNLAPVY
ncbi:MAG: hypothetical protein Q8M76_12405, partial [Spirochaetaceae bacterium]|nr:hypothetical protein [Spirochaetaceae bacterium]